MQNQKLLVFVISLLVSARSASANTDSCEPFEPKALRGIVIHASLGPSFWTGKIGSASRPGIGFRFAAGYEFLSYLSIEVSWASGFHESHQPYPPARGTFATHAVHSALKLSIPIGSFDLSLSGGTGVLWSNPNILVRIPQLNDDLELGWLAGTSFIWHTPKRHVWLGLQTNIIGSKQLPGIWIACNLLIGVTL